MQVYKCSFTEIELEFQSEDGSIDLSVILSNEEAEKKAKEILAMLGLKEVFV